MSFPFCFIRSNKNDLVNRSVPRPESALENSRKYATHPHLAGSLEDELDAKSVLHLFHDEFGIPLPEELPIYKAGSDLSRNATLRLTGPHAPTRPTAWIDTYYPVMNTGSDQAVQILDESGNALWTADMTEDGDPRDPEAHKYKFAIPSWHGLSANGDVTGQLVYVNYGSYEDYRELIAQGVNLTGKIVIARYGRIFRGLKVVFFFYKTFSNPTSRRSKVPKNWGQLVRSSTLIHATMDMSPLQMIILPIPLVLLETQPLSNVEAYNFSQYTLVTRPLRDILHMKMRNAPKGQIFRGFLVYQFRGRMRRDSSRKFLIFIYQLQRERNCSVVNPARIVFVWLITVHFLPSNLRNLTTFQWIPKSHRFGMPWLQFLGISRTKLSS